MTTPTLEQFLNYVKNYKLTIRQNNGVHRDLIFIDSDDYNPINFNITTIPNRLVITDDMGALVFSSKSHDDMFDFFRSDDLKINPKLWSEMIQTTSYQGKIESYSEFDIDEVKRGAQEYLDDFIKDNELSGEDESDLRCKLENSVMLAENEHEIIEKIRNFNCKGFNFEYFWEDDYRKYRYDYIWLCYAIVWGIKKFDEVSQEIKKEKQAKLKEL